MLVLTSYSCVFQLIFVLPCCNIQQCLCRFWPHDFVCLPNVFHCLSLSPSLSCFLSEPLISGKLNMTTSTSACSTSHTFSTHHWMLNSIKGNSTVIKGLDSQLLLAQTPRALNRNHWRTSGARLNTHTQSPKAALASLFFFVFHIFSLCMSQGHGNPMPERLLILSTVLRSPCLS